MVACDTTNLEGGTMKDTAWNAEQVRDHCQDPTWSLADQLDEALQLGVLTYGSEHHKGTLAEHPSVLPHVQEELLAQGDPWVRLMLSANPSVCEDVQRSVIETRVEPGEMEWGLSDVIANPALTPANQAWVLENLPQRGYLLMNQAVTAEVLAALLPRVVPEEHTHGCLCGGAAKRLKINQLGPWALSHREARFALAERSDLTPELLAAVRGGALAEQDESVLTGLARNGNLTPGQSEELVLSGNPRLVKVGASSTTLSRECQDRFLEEVLALDAQVLSSLGSNPGLLPHVQEALARHPRTRHCVTLNPALARSAREVLLEAGAGAGDLAKNEGVDHDVLLRECF
jgi:hypothetical protein